MWTYLLHFYTGCQKIQHLTVCSILLMQPYNKCYYLLVLKSSILAIEMIYCGFKITAAIVILGRLRACYVLSHA